MRVEAALVESYVVGVDTGGTFTDAVVIDRDGTVVTGKAPTTPGDLWVGFFDAIAAAADKMGLGLEGVLRRTAVVNHGTTTGINALVTGATAKVVLVTTAGHADAIRIMNDRGRSQGASLAELLDYSASSMPKPILPREQVIEVHERVDSLGDVVVALRDEELSRVAAAVGECGPEAIAICLLWSFSNNAHELELRDYLSVRYPGLPISCSHEVAPRNGVYPRAVTTIMNASLIPLMGSYVQEVAQRAKDFGFGGEVMFVQNDGGLIPAAEAKRFPILMTRSGPVAGVVGTGVVSQRVGDGNVLVADMGGTTFDIGLIADGRPDHRDEDIVERHLTHARVVNVESIGAGGGSIAWVDDHTGLLRVGPRSAGARPGPICYRRGGNEVTVTDADLVLGVLNPRRPLPGGTPLDYDAAFAGVRALGERLGLDPVQCAAGVVEIVDSYMEDHIRRMIIQRGQDPRELSLWAYGGAVGAHAGLFSRQLNVKRVVFPFGDAASVWSALGCTLLRRRREFHASVFLPHPWDLKAIASWLERLDRLSVDYAQRTEMSPGSYRLSRSANMKYGLQVHEVEVTLPDIDRHLDDDAQEAPEIDVVLPEGPVSAQWAAEVALTFEREYERQFGAGTGFSGADITMTALRVAVESTGEGIAATRQVSAGDRGDDAISDGTRSVFWREIGTWVDTPVLAGAKLIPGTRIEGPALIEYSHTTLVARPDQHLTMEPNGNLILGLGQMSVR
jgi:N-methylhydantoinase A